METKLFVVYQDGNPVGAAQSDSAEKIVTEARKAVLGSTVKVIFSAKEWHDAPIDDVIRAGLGTLVALAFNQQAVIQQAMQQRRPGLIQ